MKTKLLALSMSLLSFSAFSSCEHDAEIAATEKFRNLEYGCYGIARLVEKINPSTFLVTVSPVGGNASCIQKVYQVKFSESGRSCSIISVTRIGSGGI